MVVELLRCQISYCSGMTATADAVLAVKKPKPLSLQQIISSLEEAAPCDKSYLSDLDWMHEVAFTHLLIYF